MNQMRKEKEQAELEKERAEKNAKRAERAEHNTDHKNEQTPDNRPKAKSKTGPSPNRNQNLPPFPTGDNPESTHEPKGKAGRPTNTQAKTKAQGPPPVQKDTFDKKSRKKPNHDTEVDNNTDFKYWENK